MIDMMILFHWLCNSDVNKINYHSYPTDDWPPTWSSLSRSSSSPSSVCYISNIKALIFAVYAGILSEKFGFTIVVFVGCILMGVGLLLSSIVSNANSYSYRYIYLIWIPRLFKTIRFQNISLSIYPYIRILYIYIYRQTTRGFSSSLIQYPLD